MTQNFASIFAVGLALSASSAFATTYTYSTAGCFSNPSAPVAGTSASATCNAVGSTFTFNDLGGASEMLSFTDQATTTITGGSTSLGNFSITSSGSGTGASFNGNFSLAVSFTAPPATNGSPFSAILSGNIFGTLGGATITFSPQTEYFNSPSGDFALTLNVNPIQINTGSGPSSEVVTATIGPTPEPFSMGLLGSGLALIGLARWRKAKKG